MRGVYPFLTTFIHSFRRQKLYEKNLLTSKQKLVFCFGFVFRLRVFCFHELHKGSKYREKREKRQWRHLGFLKISYIFLSFAFFYVHLYAALMYDYFCYKNLQWVTRFRQSGLWFKQCSANCCLASLRIRHVWHESRLRHEFFAHNYFRDHFSFSLCSQKSQWSRNFLMLTRLFFDRNGGL